MALHRILKNDPQPDSPSLCSVPTDAPCPSDLAAMREAVAQLRAEFADLFQYRGQVLDIEPLDFFYPPAGTPLPKNAFRKGFQHQAEDWSFLTEELAQWLDYEHVYKWHSPSPWCSPIFAVKADANGHRRRSVTAYQGPNDYLPTVSFPMPRFEEVLTALTGKRYFSALDIKHCYHQIPITKEAQVYTTFPFGPNLYRWQVLPEGFSNAVAMCQSVLNRYLLDEPGPAYPCLDGKVLWLDDILMFSDTWQEQIASLRQLFTRARLIGLVFHPIKSEFLLTEVCWFGRDIGHGEVRPPVDYIGRLLLRTKPATYTDLREWCGGLNWVIAHIPNAMCNKIAAFTSV